MKSVVFFVISLALFTTITYCTRQRRLQKQTSTPTKICCDWSLYDNPPQLIKRLENKALYNVI